MCLSPYGSVFNAVAKSVCNSVIPPASMPGETWSCLFLLTYVRQSVCVYAMEFLSGHKQINKI